MDMKIENRGGRMTEQEAIEILSLDEKEKKLLKNLTPVYEVAIKALESDDQYRAIGTVSELQDLVIGINALADSQFSAADMAKLVNDMKSLYEYLQIGTPEERRAAVEKQKAKKPDFEGDGYADGHLVYDTWICPCCGKHYEVDYDDYDFCPNCGQKLDCSDE